MKKHYTLFLASLVLLINSCKKADAEPESKMDYYFQITVDGVKNEFIVPKSKNDDSLIVGSKLLGYPEGVFLSNIRGYSSNATTMAVTKGVMKNFIGCTDDEFFAFFSPGLQNFASFWVDNGVILTWIDRNGQIWDSYPQEKDGQKGSSLRIVKTSRLRSPTGKFFVKTTIEFDCKLFDGAGGFIKASGVYVGLFGKEF